MPLRTIADRMPLDQRATLRRLGAIPLTPRLDWLARWYGTDKGPAHHGYTKLYQRHLASRRWERLAILEIGVGGTESPETGGPSLRMWRSFFPRARIVAIDIRPKLLPREKRITILQGDQSDTTFLTDVDQRHGPFDVIIDDGSHRGQDIATTFATLWPQLNARGLYVIEDLETAYDVTYGGGPPGTPGTAIALLANLLDRVQTEPMALHIYRNIAFIEKSVATQSAMS